MREIKFQAWDEKEKCWVSGFAIHQSGMFSDWAGCKKVNGQCIADANWQYPQKIPYIKIMQYTGLKDKNGREGYHKDIWLFHGVHYTIEWDEENACFYLEHSHERATADDHIPINYLSEGEIVGNVFENPDLVGDHDGH